MLLFPAMISRHADANLAGGPFGGFASGDEACGLTQLLDDFVRGMSFCV